MSDLLSKGETDSLLKAVDEGQVPPRGDDPAPAPQPRPLDLTRQDRSVRGRLPGLDRLVDRLLQDLPAALAPWLGQLPLVAVPTLELRELRAVVAELGPPLGLLTFTLAPLPGQGMIVVTGPLLELMLQVSLGGDPGATRTVVAREPSRIEIRLVERLATRLLDALREAWRPVSPLECRILGTETNPRYATPCAPDDLLLVLEVVVSLEGGGAGTALVCIPDAALDVVRPRLLTLAPDGRERRASDGWRTRLRALLDDAEVEVRVELGRRRLPLRDVLALAVGDVLAIGTPREGPVIVRVAGCPRFQGAPGVSAGNNAVRVTATI